MKPVQTLPPPHSGRRLSLNQSSFLRGVGVGCSSVGLHRAIHRRPVLSAIRVREQSRPLWPAFAPILSINICPLARHDYLLAVSEGFSRGDALRQL